MEQNHKNNDCYFFYYSTCTKGDSCGFRHEPSALGCEVMCTYWQQGNCLNEKCNFRHMELKKNRKAIACYWESQRGGCKKPHCPFMHSQPRPTINDSTPAKTTELPIKPVNQEWSNRPDDGKLDGSGTESDQGRGSSETGSFIGSPAVDPLIVNFDEESDSEGVASSPRKSQKTTRVPYCKTYEQIRLEEIQAESAAYYSYTPGDYVNSAGLVKEKRINSIRTTRVATGCLYVHRALDKASSQAKLTNDTLAFKVLTLDEIKRRKNETTLQSDKSGESETNVNAKKEKMSIINVLTSLGELDKKSLARSQKRSLGIGDEWESKRCKITNSILTTQVAPVRLRRSATRLNPWEEVVHANEKTSRSDENQNDSQVEMKVRLYDSSTNESSNVNQVSTLSIRKTSEKETAADVSDDLKFDQLIAGNSQDAALLDNGSDDILKDIDALLTEKSA